MYSRPIFADFENETGTRVLVQYDTEANKTTGLVNRLIAEKNRPRADVFWNNETAQTIHLKKNGILEPYASAAALPIPDTFKDDENYWTGFAARGRVIVYNTELTADPPKSLHDFTKAQWKGKLAIANPLFGTTATHAAALFALWGEVEAGKFFMALKRNNVAVLPGNATVRDMVGRGEYVAGLTDTDDANSGMEAGLPIDWLFPDQHHGGIGTLIIPNTVALVHGAPHPESAKALIDFLLRPATELALANLPSIQIPLNPAVEVAAPVPSLLHTKTMDVDFESIANAMKTSATFIQKKFLP